MSDAPAPNPFDDGARCFIALLPDAASIETLLACRTALADGMPGAAHRLRWIDRAALHLTLRFLGAASAPQQEQLVRAMSDLSRPLHPLATRRYGIWPNRARPRLLVLELARDVALVELADACESRVQAAGFAPETRPFRAHVSMARLRPGCAFGELPAPPPVLAFDSLSLMQSHLTQPAATYRELHRARLE